YIQGTQAMLELAKNCHAKKFLLLSSGSVNGFIMGESYQPGYEYRRGKFSSETILATYRPFMDTTIARIYTAIGVGVPEHFAAHKFIQDGIKGGPIELYGDGKSTRTYLY